MEITNDLLTQVISSGWILIDICFTAHDASDDEEDKEDDDFVWDDMTVNGTDSSVSGSFVPPAGAPFSALTPSIWPQDILARIQQVIILI